MPDPTPTAPNASEPPRQCRSLTIDGTQCQKPARRRAEKEARENPELLAFGRWTQSGPRTGGALCAEQSVYGSGTCDHSSQQRWRLGQTYLLRIAVDFCFDPQRKDKFGIGVSEIHSANHRN